MLHIRKRLLSPLKLSSVVVGKYQTVSELDKVQSQAVKTFPIKLNGKWGFSLWWKSTLLAGKEILHKWKIHDLQFREKLDCKLYNITGFWSIQHNLETFHPHTYKLYLQIDSKGVNIKDWRGLLFSLLE